MNRLINIYGYQVIVNDVNKERIDEILGNKKMKGYTYHGLFVFTEMVIYLREDLCVSVRDNVFIHEVGHMLNAIFGTQESYSEEEMCVFFAAHFPEIMRVFQEFKSYDK